jgi:hypothetical protein
MYSPGIPFPKLGQLGQVLGETSSDDAQSWGGGQIPPHLHIGRWPGPPSDVPVVPIWIGGGQGAPTAASPQGSP